jgi:hypothetical protein
MQLRELFKPSPVTDQHVNSWEWRYRNDEFAQALFKVGDVVYMFSASHDNDEGDDGDWSIEFQSMKKVKGISGFDNTGTGNEVEVFNTVIDIIKTLLADLGHRVQRLNFSAATSRRKSLYARMAHRLLPNWQLDQYGDHFTLTRPKPQHKRQQQPQPQEEPEVVDENFDVSPLSGSGGTPYAEKIPVPVELRGLADLWNKFGEENPNIKLALSLTPVVGTGINAIDLSAAVSEGDVGSAVIAALGLIPGFKALTKLEQFRLTSQQLARLDAYIRAHKLSKFINQSGSVYDWASNILSK